MSEILTEDEEAAFVIVRQALADARSGGGTADFRRLSVAISASGARVIAETNESASFAHRSARFTMRSLSQLPGSFELSFQALDP